MNRDIFTWGSVPLDFPKVEQVTAQEVGESDIEEISDSWSSDITIYSVEISDIRRGEFDEPSRISS